MKNKIEKINVLNKKIKTSNLDVDSIELLSKIADELSVFKDKIAEEAYVIPAQNGFSALRKKMLNLEESRIALQTRIHKRGVVCRAIQTNESIITSTMEKFAAFLKQFTSTFPDLGEYKESLFQNLKINEEFNDVFEQFITQDKKGSNQDIMANLFQIFKESIEEANEDKAYFLSKLKEMNDIGKACADALKDSIEAFVDTEDASKGDSNSDRNVLGYTNIKLKKATASLQNALGVIGKVVKEKQDRAREEKEEREEQEKRDHTVFENFDQKSSQLFNLLSTVIKSIKEMQIFMTRNIL